MRTRYIIILLALSLATLPASARALDIGKVVGQAVTGATMMADAAKEITPSEEHYIGRAVAATILSKYPLVNNPALTKYVNEVGLLVAYASDRPSTYKGYHFAVVNSSDANAFACPGGIILVTKGLLREVKNEDQLAAVLAHEVAHVAHRHGIKAIKKDKFTKLGFYAAGEVGKAYTPSDVTAIVGEFQNVVGDVAKQVLESGYSKGDEKNADEYGLKFASAAGYNPTEMLEFIKAEGENAKPTGPFSSHPKAETRIKSMEKELKDLPPATTQATRTSRFKAMTASAR